MCSIIWSIKLTSPTIYFHNIRSLQKHCEDLVSDSLIVQSEILILQKQCPNRMIHLLSPGHSLVCIVDGNTRTPGSGTHIYSRNPVICHTKLEHTPVLIVLVILRQWLLNILTPVSHRKM